MNDWDLPSPHVETLVATHADIDEYGHVNNAVYVRWLDLASWSHTAALGMPLAACLELRRGMAVWRSQLNYLAPAFESDRVAIATWIVATDGRLRATRRFQIRRATDGRTLVRALIHYFCLDLDSGRPRRMPPEFVARYRPLESVLAAISAETVAFSPGVEPT